MEMSKLSDYEKNEENPFLKKAVERVEKNVVKKFKSMGTGGKNAIMQTYSTETGEVLGHSQFIKQIEVDEQQFAKLYLSNFTSFFNLNNQAIKVFGYILNQLVPNKDEFIFDRIECMEYTGYKSDKSVFIGLATLLSNEIIARGRTDYKYYINPMVVFNGSRLTFAKTYVKKKKKSDVHPNQTYMDFDEEGNYLSSKTYSGDHK